MKPVFDKTLIVAQTRMLDSGIPALEKIANGFFAAVGTEDVPEAYFEARRTNIGDWMNQYTEITRKLQQDDMLKADVLVNMRNPRTSRDPEVQEISQQLFRLLRQFRNYLVEAGVEIGDRGKEYFPWVWDPRQMQDNSDFVRGLLEDPRYAKEMADWLKRENDKLRRVTKGKYQITQEELVDKIMAGLMQTEGYVDHSLDPDIAGTTPWFGAMHFRSLHFIPDKLSAAEAEVWDSLFSDQLDLIMMTYIRQGVKRAEYARRFGDKSQRLLEWLEEAKDEGATRAEMEMAHNYIDA
ncbi:MAG: hypothetical protein GTO63_05840, partial [Anaerolineae bacterium]|nr:hypothetical protein [Anaerolineae bacterium]NIN94493.1 hypothetical protein [Anaerolineae bacterium]NIQ77563.1 hypothetical protein [Anaerolineae bacterium]